ncbi:peptidase S8/S53 domain-containing protein [Sparassis latifolia]
MVATPLTKNDPDYELWQKHEDLDHSDVKGRYPRFTNSARGLILGSMPIDEFLEFLPETDMSNTPRPVNAFNEEARTEQQIYKLLIAMLNGTRTSARKSQRRCPGFTFKDTATSATSRLGPIPITFLSVGSQNNDGAAGFLDVVDYFLSADTPPQVVTTSYGMDESSVTPDLATNLCNAYMQLGARGVSLLFSSGDGGVAGVTFGGEDCDGSNFIPTFPASCLYITSVGATQGVGPETAAPYSSGGFSNNFPAPSYQTTATAGYVQGLGSTYSGLYNPQGRGYPDVSAQGTNFQIVLNGEISGEEGTSAASPTFASVIALLNNELALAGHPPLGFLNPWLYGSAASALNAVTSGSNPGCGTNGFSAAAGWNPATGLGTPDYAKLRTAAGL